jgi:hypothetical protein
MIDATRALRHFVRLSYRLGGLVQALSTPWLRLGCRLWLGQLLLVQQVMSMMTAAIHTQPDAAGEHGLVSVYIHYGLEGTPCVVGTFFLMFGLLTRPVALLLLLHAVQLVFEGGSSGRLSPAIALLAWLIVAGPGPLSLDRLLGHGLIRSAFGPAATIGRFYIWATRTLGPIVLLLVRFGTAAMVAAPTLAALSGLRNVTLFGGTMLPTLSDSWQVAIAGALILGIAARPVALALAGAVPLSGITMSMDNRLTVLLVFLTIACAGAGLLSVDRLIVLWARGVRDNLGLAKADLPHVIVVGVSIGTGTGPPIGIQKGPCSLRFVLSH